MSLSKIAIKALKPLAMRTVYREGAIRTMLTGPSQGLRYRSDTWTWVGIDEIASCVSAIWHAEGMRDGRRSSWGIARPGFAIAYRSQRMGTRHTRKLSRAFGADADYAPLQKIYCASSWRMKRAIRRPAAPAAI